MEQTKKERMRTQKNGGFFSALIAALCAAALLTVILIAAEAAVLMMTPLTEKAMLIFGYAMRAVAVASGAILFARKSPDTRGVLRALAVGGAYWFFMALLCYVSGKTNMSPGKLALDACICVTVALAAGAFGGKKKSG